MEKENFDDLDDFLKTSSKNNKLRKRKRKKITILLINIFSITFLVAGGFGLKMILDYKEDLGDNVTLQNSLSSFVENIKKEKENANETNRIIFDSLLNKNSDTIGWLTVKGTSINMPIVQASDNKYYLNHNFEKAYNYLGWVFADYRNNFPNLNQNTIIYGHTMRGELMFSTLSNVLTKNWLDNSDNYIINFSTTDEILSWEVFSIYTTKVTNDYLKINFNDQEFNYFIDKIKEKSIQDFNVEVNKDDKILTLSTCYINSKNRLVVHAKLIV